MVSALIMTGEKKQRRARKRSQPPTTEREMTIDDYTSGIFVEDLQKLSSIVGCIIQCGKYSGETSPLECMPQLTLAEPIFKRSPIGEAFELRKDDGTTTHKVILEGDNETTIHSASVHPGSMHSLYYESFSRRKASECGPLSSCLAPTGR